MKILLTAPKIILEYDVPPQVLRGFIFIPALFFLSFLHSESARILSSPSISPILLHTEFFASSSSPPDVLILYWVQWSGMTKLCIVIMHIIIIHIFLSLSLLVFQSLHLWILSPSSFLFSSPCISLMMMVDNLQFRCDGKEREKEPSTASDITTEKKGKRW